VIEEAGWNGINLFALLNVAPSPRHVETQSRDADPPDNPPAIANS
jgi:hypothetical protein